MFALDFSDACKSAQSLAKHVDRLNLTTDRFTALQALRLRLAGLLDRDPGDGRVLAASGLVSLAAMEPSDEREVRKNIVAKMTKRHNRGVSA